MLTISSQTLSHCELITDEGIRHIGTSACATEVLKVIELDNCPLITDASLEHLMGCHGLQRIELYDCQLITRAGIRRLQVSSPSISLSSQIVIKLLLKFKCWNRNVTANPSLLLNRYLKVVQRISVLLKVKGLWEIFPKSILSFLSFLSPQKYMSLK